MAENKTIKERILCFLEVENIRKSTFEKLCGFPNGTINNSKGGYKLEKLDKILKMYPKLNREWLLYGQGSMLRTDTATILSNNTNSNVCNTINDSTLIDALSEQLRVANEQLRQKDEQLKHAHEQLTEKDKQISQLFALLSAK